MSLKVSSQYLEEAKNALKSQGINQTILVNKLGISRSTVSNFFNGKPVKSDLFLEICKSLKLDVQKIMSSKENEPAELSSASEDSDNFFKILLSKFRKIKINRGNYNENVRDVIQIETAIFNGAESKKPEKATNSSVDLDSLVLQLRDKVCTDIQTRCGEMKILDMSQPIELGKIYTKVNILEKIIGRSRKDISELFEQFNLEDFNRFNFGKLEFGLYSMEKKKTPKNV